MPPVDRSNEKAYYAQARSWAEDRAGRAERVIRTQKWMIATLSLVALTLGAALVMLVPLKQAIPYVVRVDASTGIVDNVVRVTGSQMTEEEAVTRYYVRRYVALRENYTRSQIEPAFREMALLTTAQRRTELQKEFAFTSATSPYKRFGEQGTRTIRIKNVSRVAGSVYQVRFLAIEAQLGVEKTTHHVATIEYEYQRMPEKESVLGVNPLGFVVTSYRSDEEATVAEVVRQ